MNLTITTLDDRLINIEVSEDIELENLKAQCEFELGIPAAKIVLTWNGRPLNDNKKTLKQYGIGNCEMLLLQQMNQPAQPSQPRPSGSGASGILPMIDFGSIAMPGSAPPPRPDLEDPLVILELIKNNPHERALLKERNPPLSDALESGNTGRFIEVYTKQRNERLKREEERNKMISLDPFSSEAQRLIAEEIRMKNVESNMESAIEHVPESFGQVVMLYVDCKVNGHPVKAFVDSGAQMTIMSQACAERCNIMRLVDQRWAGIAKGVGTQKIIGRVHLGLIQIENDFLQSSFSILEDQPMDMLLGLDMLKRHQCVIDLQKNELLMGTTGTRTSFLAENQLPAYARNREPGSESADEELAKALHKSAEEAAGSSNLGAAGATRPVTSTQPGSQTQGVNQGPQNTLNNQPNSQTHSQSTSAQGFSHLEVSGSGPSQGSTQSQGATGQEGAGTGSQSGNPYPETVIRSLVENGYSRHDVIRALTESNGDSQKAHMALLARSLKFP